MFLSFIGCPLCGKSSSLRYFAPTEMKLNIVVHSVKGLGRGRGFQVTSPRSIIEDPEYLDIRKQIADRLIELLTLLVRDGTTSTSHILQQLGIADEIKAKFAMMEEARKMQSLNLKILAMELDEKRAKIAQMEEEKRPQPTKLPPENQSASVTKILHLQEENRSLVAKMNSNDSEKRELEAQSASMETEVDHLLLIAGLRPARYRDLDAKFEALGDELRAVRALHE